MKRRLTIFKTKQNALLLTAFAAACTLTVSLTHLWTAPKIEAQKQLAILSSINELLDGSKFNNNPLNNCVIASEPLLTGVEQNSTIYRATIDNVPYAIVFKTQTEQGYNGLIELLVAVDGTGTVQGVRTLTHKETPGLGDKIELVKSNWILSFDGKNVRSPDDTNWDVKKYGGSFDQFTGATITPRAIVTQIKQAIWAAQQNFSRIFSAANQCGASTSIKDTDNRSIDTNSDAQETPDGL